MAEKKRKVNDTLETLAEIFGEDAIPRLRALFQSYLGQAENLLQQQQAHQSALAGLPLTVEEVQSGQGGAPENLFDYAGHALLRQKERVIRDIYMAMIAKGESCERAFTRAKEAAEYYMNELPAELRNVSGSGLL